MTRLVDMKKLSWKTFNCIFVKVVLANDEMEKMEDIMEESAEGQRLRFLENEIHKTNLKLMEGDTIKKKYTSILDMLKKERLTFSL